jgi:hypothetical protein
LIRHFEAHIKAQGVTGIHLGTTNHNHKAVPFYYRMGYVMAYESDRVSHPVLDDLTLITFAKRLT